MVLPSGIDLDLDDFVDHARYSELPDMLEALGAAISHCKPTAAVASDPVAASEWSALRTHLASLPEDEDDVQEDEQNLTKPEDITPPLAESTEGTDGPSSEPPSSSGPSSARALQLLADLDRQPRITSPALRELMIAVATTGAPGSGHTALHVAAANGAGPGVLGPLLSGLESVNASGVDALASAYAGRRGVTTGPLRVVEAANPRSGLDGSTPLHYAALNGHAGVALALLRCGADPTARNDSGRSPVTVAEQQSHFALVNCLLGAFEPAAEDAAVASESGGGSGRDATAEADDNADDADAAAGVQGMSI
ncbi:hypothetical protein HK405_004371 [Cladochytrium tenue]|nr:hypothetical protein HK405_004371 [Cladochytrium tenue]